MHKSRELPAQPPKPVSGRCPEPATRKSALGDRTRRSILEKLVDGPAAVGVLADHVPISRPAVSQHLRVLKDAGLVVESAAGTRRLYRIDRAGLTVVRDYLDRFSETTLDNFALLASAEAEAHDEEE